MKSYKSTLYSLLILTVIGLVTYLSLNAYDFTSTSIIEKQPKYSQVRIYAVNENDFKRIQDAGLFIDHANTKIGSHSDTWLSEDEINLLRMSGVSYEVLVDDWQTYFDNQPKMTNAEVDASIEHTEQVYSISRSIYGTMGGYMTYAEVVSKLDSMRIWYPQFISTKFSIGTTFEGRTQWAVRITHNPDAPTGRPQVLYHALIHAREPESMETQFFYFLWLMENYNTDITARYILDNREIYWLPVFNVDGYVYNQTTNPNGGGMWRANRHVTSGNCGFVDPNRNFGIYQYWNSSNNGSSTDPCAGGQGTYRGTLPFSELETQNVMNFVNTHNFNAAFGAHTYGNYLIKPWCWSDPSPTPDDAKFNTYLADMKYSNPVYTTGPPSLTVGYQVRGGADDWYYNDSTHAGHHIMAITPETDALSFWPPQSKILPLAEGMLFNNTYMSLIGGPFVSYLNSNLNQPSYTPGSSGTYRVRFQNKGTLIASNTHIILTPSNANLTVPTQQYDFNVGVFGIDSATFNFNIGGGAANNCYLPATLTFKQDTTTVYSIGVFIPIGTPTSTTIFTDNASSFANWTAGGTASTWGTSTTQFNSAPSSFSESPTGSYANGVDLNMTLTYPINVSSSTVVSLSFFHRYATEPNFDFCMVEVSSNNGNTWQPVAEYSGTLSTWTQQTIDITRYANRSTQMKVRFRLVSDAGVTGDGWYVDDITINTSCVSLITGIQNNNETPMVFALEQNYPNPFNPATVIKYQLPKSSNVTIRIFDILGKEVATLVNGKVDAGYHQVEFNGSDFASGLYLYKIEADGFTDVKKMMLIK
ncbi:MAG: M14 family zinc carboxypeptidase [Ignavibacteria bacterium]